MSISLQPLAHHQGNKTETSVVKQDKKHRFTKQTIKTTTKKEKKKKKDPGQEGEFDLQSCDIKIFKMCSFQQKGIKRKETLEGMAHIQGKRQSTENCPQGSPMVGLTRQKP